MHSWELKQQLQDLKDDSVTQEEFQDALKVIARLRLELDRVKALVEQNGKETNR